MNDSVLDEEELTYIHTHAHTYVRTYPVNMYNRSSHVTHPAAKSAIVILVFPKADAPC